jgi:peptidoglycan/LPS O-acetylase OafA/YrhL
MRHSGQMVGAEAQGVGDSNPKNKFESLECLRGIAAITVFFCHFSLSFAPLVMGPLWFETEIKPGPYLYGTLFFGPVNGHFAVAIFFVLSSYVLTYKILEGGPRSLVWIGMIKRIPRLGLLTLIGCVLPFLLLTAGLMANDQVAVLNGSKWLGHFGGVNQQDWQGPVSLLRAIMDGTILVFFRGTQFNAAFWTMKFEFYGSILAFLTAGVLVSRWPRFVRWGVVCLLTAFAARIHGLCAICVVTVCLAHVYDPKYFRINSRVAVILIIAGLVLGSFFSPVGAWSFPTLVNLQAPYSELAKWTILGVGATLIFAAVRWSPLQEMMRGNVARFLGTISYPLYAIHIPLIASMACLIYLHNSTVTGIVLAAVATLFTACGSARILAVVDKAWVSKVNLAADRISKLVSPSSSEARRLVPE